MRNIDLHYYQIINKIIVSLYIIYFIDIFSNAYLCYSVMIMALLLLDKYPIYNIFS